MTRWLIALALLAGCATQEDVDRATRDQLELNTRLVGYALEANHRSLETHRALLEAFPPGSEGHDALVEVLGDEAELERRRLRLADDREALLELAETLRKRYGASSDRE